MRRRATPRSRKTIIWHVNRRKSSNPHVSACARLPRAAVAVSVMYVLTSTFDARVAENRAGASKHLRGSSMSPVALDRRRGRHRGGDEQAASIAGVYQRQRA